MTPTHIVTYQDLGETKTVKVEANSNHQAIVFAQVSWKHNNQGYNLTDCTDSWEAKLIPTQPLDTTLRIGYTITMKQEQTPDTLHGASDLSDARLGFT